MATEGGAADGGAQGAGTGAGAAKAGDFLGVSAGAGGESGGQGGGQKGAAAQTGAQAEGQGDAAVEAFYGQFSATADGDSPALRDWVRSIGVKDVDGLAKAAREHQRALRDSGLVKVPGEGATPEELDSFRKAIGVPEKPEGYKMPVVNDADGKPIEFSSERLETIAKLAHANGIPASALEPTLQAIAEADALELATREGELVAKANAHANKWGAQREANLAAINRACEALGMTREESLALRAAWGPERAMDVLAKLGSGIGEDTMITAGGRQKFALSGAEAQAALDTKRQDGAWTARAVVEGTAENAEYMRLLEAAAAAADRQLQE